MAGTSSPTAKGRPKTAHGWPPLRSQISHESLAREKRVSYRSNEDEFGSDPPSEGTEPEIGSPDRGRIELRFGR